MKYTIFAGLIILGCSLAMAAPVGKASGSASAKKKPTAKPTASPTTLIIEMPVHPRVDSALIQKLYLGGDFDEAIAILEHNLKETRQFSHGDSVFIYKHLGVMYAARYETREKGKLYMHRLLMVEPTAKIMDMYASDMIYMIFKNIQDEFQSNRMRLGQTDTHDTEPGRTQSKSGVDSARVSDRQSGSKSWLWFGAAGVAVAAGVGAYFIINSEPVAVTEESQF